MGDAATSSSIGTAPSTDDAPTLRPNFPPGVNSSTLLSTLTAMILSLYIPASLLTTCSTIPLLGLYYQNIYIKKLENVKSD